MRAHSFNRRLYNLRTRFFGASRDHFRRSGQDFSKKSGRDRLGFLRLGVISGNAFIHVNIAIRTGVTTNSNMLFSSERTSHNLLQWCTCIIL